MRVVKEDGLPIKLWLEDIEDSALDQARNLARLPFAFSHIALMPDAHPGYWMPIGGVIGLTLSSPTPLAWTSGAGCWPGSNRHRSASCPSPEIPASSAPPATFARTSSWGRPDS